MALLKDEKADLVKKFQKDDNDLGSKCFSTLYPLKLRSVIIFL